MTTLDVRHVVDGVDVLVTVTLFYGGAIEADPETRQARDAVPAELDELERTGRSRDGSDFGGWLTAAIREHEEWLAPPLI